MGAFLPLLRAFALRYWKPLAGVALGLFVWWQIHAYGTRQRDIGRDEQVEVDRIAREAATRRHNAKVEKLDHDYAKQFTTLTAQRDDALAHPAIRVIRVPVASVCPNPVTENAGVSGAGNPGPEFVDVDDRSYDSFRDWLIRYASTSSDGRGGAAVVSGHN